MNSCTQDFIAWVMIIFAMGYLISPYALLLLLLGWKCDGEDKINRNKNEKHN